MLHQILFLAGSVNGEYSLIGLNAVCIHKVCLGKGNNCFCKMEPDSFYQHSMNQSSLYPLSFYSTFPFRINFFLFSHWFACAKKVKSYRKSAHSLSCLWKSSIFQLYAAAYLTDEKVEAAETGQRWECCFKSPLCWGAWQAWCAKEQCLGMCTIITALVAKFPVSSCAVLAVVLRSGANIALC